MRAPMAHGRSLEGARRQERVGKAERTDVGENIGDAKRPPKVPEVLEEPWPVGPLREPPVLLVAEARSDEVLGLSCGVDGGDGPIAGTGECAGAFDDLAKDGLEVKAFAHAKDRAGQGGDAFVMRLDIVPRVSPESAMASLFFWILFSGAEFPFPFATACRFQEEESGEGRSLSQSFISIGTMMGMSSGVMSRWRMRRIGGVIRASDRFDGGARWGFARMRSATRRFRLARRSARAIDQHELDTACRP